MTGILKKERTQRRMWRWRQRLSYDAINQRTPGAIRRWKRQGSPWSLQRKYVPADMLISDFYPPELWQNKTNVLSCQDCGKLLWEPWTSVQWYCGHHDTCRRDSYGQGDGHWTCHIMSSCGELPLFLYSGTHRNQVHSTVSVDRLPGLNPSPPLLKCEASDK